MLTIGHIYVSILPTSINIKYIILIKVSIRVCCTIIHEQYVMFHHIKKYFLNKSYTDHTNKLFKTLLVTMTYNLYRLLH
jgi:hypothetical protein